MRNWLSKEEQEKMLSIYGGETPFFDHIHLVYRSGGYNYKYDLIRLNSKNDYEKLNLPGWHIDSDESYKGWSFNKLLELIPATIYCDNEYNVVDKNTTHIYNTLKFYFIKVEDENPDINYMYKMGYKKLSPIRFKKRIIIKNNEIKNPELESDEPIEMIQDLFYWLISHGHIKKKEKSKKENNEKNLKQVIKRGH